MYSPSDEAIRLNEAARTVPSGTGESKQSAAVACRLERALQQHRDRHRARPSGHRRQEARNLLDGRVDVAADPLVGARPHDRHIRHRPVVDAGRVVGVISIGDVVRSVIDDLRFTVRQLESYIKSGG